MTRYLANAFSLSMLKIPGRFTIDIKELSSHEFCVEVTNPFENIVNAIGHESTVSLVNSMCKTDLKSNRIMIQLTDWDELLLIQVMTRLPEGKTLSEEELKELLNKGLVKFLKITVISSIPEKEDPDPEINEEKFLELIDCIYPDDSTEDYCIFDELEEDESEDEL
ncbi:MAG: DUF1874 domain-containing protein [Desulfurococcaceae archaeon]